MDKITKKNIKTKCHVSNIPPIRRKLSFAAIKYVSKDAIAKSLMRRKEINIKSVDYSWRELSSYMFCVLALEQFHNYPSRMFFIKSEHSNEKEHLMHDGIVEGHNDYYYLEETSISYSSSETMSEVLSSIKNKINKSYSQSEQIILCISVVNLGNGVIEFNRLLLELIKEEIEAIKKFKHFFLVLYSFDNDPGKDKVRVIEVPITDPDFDINTESQKVVDLLMKTDIAFPLRHPSHAHLTEV